MNVALSVIIPTFERPVLVRQALESVACQLADAVEVVVVNDGSTRTYDLDGIVPARQLQVIHSASNRGASHSRNLGIKRARGQWVSFLDDDDSWHPDFIAETLALHATVDQPAFSWCGVVNHFHGENGVIVNSETTSFQSSGSIEEVFLQAIRIGSGYGLTIHRDCFERAGTFDCSYSFTEDTDLVLRLLASGCAPHPMTNVMVDVHHRPNLNRLTAPENYPKRVEEIHRMLAAHKSFLGAYPALRDAIMNYARHLEGLCSMPDLAELQRNEL